MKHKNILLTLFVVMFLSLNVFAEKAFMKFGKISEQEINMSVCPIDSNASAVVLGAIGNTNFEMTEEGMFQVFTKHIRIKIFDKEAFDEGNFRIPLYKSGGNEEKVRLIKGAVYNMVDGKLVKTKLTRDNIFRENVNKNRDLVKVVMPDVKEGSIIDFTYSTGSPFMFNVEAWYFQTEIPTLKSIYEVGVIEWYNYKSWIEGYFTVDKTTERKIEKFSYYQSTYHDPTGANMTRVQGGRREFDAEVNYQVYSAENIPAFKEEPYITNPYDYYSSVHFELRSTKYPWSVLKMYTKSWKDINELLMDSEDFGTTIKYGGHLKDIAAKIEGGTQDKILRAKLAYEHIRNNMAWDGRYRIQVDKSIRNAYNEKGGSSADINLNLVSLCRKVGLQTFPVLVSTRRHGKIRPGYPNLSQFNHVIAAVKIDGNYLLLDAIDKNCPYNLLPPQSLNDRGRLVNGTEGEWVDLYSSLPSSSTYMASLSFNENMELSGDLSVRNKNYGALKFRRNYKSEESEEDFIIEYEEELDGIKINEFSVENIDSLHKPVTVKSKISITKGVNKANNLIFFNPKIIGQREENIFKLEERVYPVDYNYPHHEKYIFTVQLPEGYVVDEMPEPLAMALPENKGRYVYKMNAVGNMLQVTCQFMINRTVFSGVDYPELKKFYELIVAKEAEQVVLKKVN